MEQELTKRISTRHSAMHCAIVCEDPSFARNFQALLSEHGVPTDDFAASRQVSDEPATDFRVSLIVGERRSSGLSVDPTDSSAITLRVADVDIAEIEAYALSRLGNVVCPVPTLISTILQLQQNWEIGAEQAEEVDVLERCQEDLNRTISDLNYAAERFVELFNRVPVACFTFGVTGLIHEWNQAAEDLFGFEGFEVFQKPVWQYLGGTGGTWGPSQIGQLLADGGSEGFDWSFEDSVGRLRVLACTVFVLRNRTGGVIGAICSNLDITERKIAEHQVNEFAKELEMQRGALLEANARLEQLATTDALTGLSNHRQFQERLQSCFATHAVEDSELSLILLDIDFFKQLNDDFGHLAGDGVLGLFGQLLGENALPGEEIFRYGGEEFAVLLPGKGANEAYLSAERFRKAIEVYPWSLRPTTASFGVATAHKTLGQARELIGEADKAMYASKLADRNCTHHFASIAILSSDKAA